MKRSSPKGYKLTRLAIVCFFALMILLPVSSSKPWASTLTDLPLDIKEESSVHSSFSTEPIAVRLTPVSLVDDPQLTLNKHHEPNPGVTSWQIGVPITYVITLSNSGAANTHISIADTLPSGFVFISATCTANSGASCPNSTLPLPPFGPFSIPTGGNVEVRVTGYFTSGGSKTNTALASANDDQGNVINVGSANSSVDQLQVASNLPAVNVAVTKAVSPTTTTFPAHLHYTITVTNTTATGVYLNGNLRLRDFFSLNPSLPINWTVSNPTCTASGGADCPDMPSVPNNSSTILFPYDATGASTANDNGWLPGNGSYKIEFDVDIAKTATCGPAQVVFSNSAVLDSLGGFSDSIPSDNSSLVNTTINTGLTPCALTDPTVTKIQCTTATGPCTSGSTANWNTPVRYRVTVNNPTSGPLTNIALGDLIYKTTGTPTFTATVTVNPQCVSGCTGLTSPMTASPTVNLDFTVHQLWSAILPSLPASQQAVIDYTVVYAPVCETDAQPDFIINRITAGPAWGDITTNMTPEAATCNLKVDKTKVTAGPIVFEQPTTYDVVFANLSATPLAITVRDALSISSSQYGSFTFTYSTSCAVTSGTVTSPPSPQSNSTATVFYQQFGWQGLRLIDQHANFGPMSTLKCQVTVTAHKPPETSSFCQGAGNPQLVNAAYVGLSSNYNPNAQPTFYDSEAADLPLCRSVIVTKTAASHSYGPGATITYTITAENKGDDPVSSLTLKDVIQPPLTLPMSVTPCNPSSACISGPTLNTTTNPPQVDVSYGLIQPGQKVSFDLTITAPQAGGSDPNLAVGSFLPLTGKDFYFKGDEQAFLQQEENIQVLTPTLTKSFDPSQIGPNGTSTLVFNVTNTNSDPNQNGISFSDTLPAGLEVVNVITSGCGGTVAISSDNRTITLTAGQLINQHSCQIVVKVKATGVCGVYLNNKNNFSNVVNLDVSNVNQQLEVTGCQPPTDSCQVSTKEISCKADASGGYLYTFTVTNNTGHVVTDILLTPPANSNFTLSQQQFQLLPAGLGTGESLTLQVTINGGQTGQPACFDVTLMTKDGECCSTRVCPVLPDCCGLAKDETIECNKDGTYTYTLSIINTGVNTIEHIYLYPPVGVTMTPNYFPVSLKPGDTFTTKVTIKGAKPGDKLCFDISLHTANMERCCKGRHCIVLPACRVSGLR